MKQLVIVSLLTAALTGCATHGTRTTQNPQPAREDIEWLDVWMPDTNARNLPRVLLIGDSITRAYYAQVEAKLKGQAYVARLATSKSAGDPALFEEVSLALKEQRFDIIHLNNGMHGHGYTEVQYKRGLAQLLGVIRNLAPQAKLILATTTPVRQGRGMTEFGPWTERVRERNRIVKELAARHNIPVDDLFALVEEDPAYYAGGDGVHLVAKGVAAQAKQVAAEIRKHLETK